MKMKKACDYLLNETDRNVPFKFYPLQNLYFHSLSGTGFLICVINPTSGLPDASDSLNILLYHCQHMQKNG